MALLSVQNLKLTFGGPPLLDGVSFDVEAGERICLIGRNGEGKSTLFKILLREMTADEGDIVCQTGLRLARLVQEIPPHIEGTVRDIILEDQNGERNAAKEAVLGRSGIDPDALYDSLSGGQKRRVLFAKALAAEPDILLLDEPTNHLDIPSIQWMEGILGRFNGAILFISHDRAFVRRLAGRILELDRGRIRSWNCTYDKFVEFQSGQIEDEEKAAKLFDKRLAEEEVWIRKGIKARRTRNEGRVRALVKMREERSNRRSRMGNVTMQITEADRSGKLVARIENISYSYGDKPLIQDFSTEITRGDRIGIVGANGSGKTTLLRLMLGELKPNSGSVRLGTNLEIAYFDQMRNRLREDSTLIENVGDGQEYITLNGKQKHVLSYLQDFLFSPNRARGTISALSGGERNRLLLAGLFSRPSNILVLDEPTNDLDMETLDLLVDLLADYAGTVLVVSHDRSFLDAMATTIIGIEESGEIHEVVGGYLDYEESQKRRNAEKSFKAEERKKMATTTLAPKKKRSFKEEREFEQLPQKIEALEIEIEALQQKLIQPSIYTNSDKLILVQADLAQKEASLLAGYERFEELDEIGK